jgi:hypothetical protein
MHDSLSGSPFDNRTLRQLEFNWPSRFGGLVNIEDTYLIGIVGKISFACTIGLFCLYNRSLLPVY